MLQGHKAYSAGLRGIREWLNDQLLSETEAVGKRRGNEMLLPQVDFRSCAHEQPADCMIELHVSSLHFCPDANLLGIAGFWAVRFDGSDSSVWTEECNKLRRCHH